MEKWIKIGNQWINLRLVTRVVREERGKVVAHFAGNANDTETFLGPAADELIRAIEASLIDPPADDQ